MKRAKTNAAEVTNMGNLLPCDTDVNVNHMPALALVTAVAKHSIHVHAATGTTKKEDTVGLIG